MPWDDQGQGSTAFCSLHVDFLICLPVCSLDLRRLEWLFLFVFPGLTERLKRYSPIWAVISFCYLCWLVGFCFDLRVWVGVEVDNYSNSRLEDNAHACVCVSIKIREAGGALGEDVFAQRKHIFIFSCQEQNCKLYGAVISARVRT